MINPKWIEALRDPATKQARSCLKQADGAMCCLGVGLVVAGVENKQEDNGGDYRFTYTDLDGRLNTSTGMPEGSHYNLLGISPELACALAKANDSGASFAMIADFLEKGDSTMLIDYVDRCHDPILQGYRPGLSLAK